METFSALLAICAGNSSVPVNSPHKGQWRGALMFSLICARINDWVNNRKAGDLRRHRVHYDVILMITIMQLSLTVARSSVTRHCINAKCKIDIRFELTKTLNTGEVLDVCCVCLFFRALNGVIMCAMTSKNHRRLDCLFNLVFMRRSTKTSKIRVTGLCEGNSQVTGELPSQRPVTQSFDVFFDRVKLGDTSREWFIVK